MKPLVQVGLKICSEFYSPTNMATNRVIEIDTFNFLAEPTVPISAKLVTNVTPTNMATY